MKYSYVFFGPSSFQYDVNGFAVIENFLSDNEANELRTAGLELCQMAPETDRKIFNTKDRKHCKGNLIFFFWEMKKT